LLLAGEVLFAVSDLQYEDVQGGGMPSSRWVAHLLAVGQGTQPGPSRQPSASTRSARTPAGTPAEASPQRILVHTWPVLSVAFSPDGRTLATGSGDASVRLWEIATGRRTAKLTDHTWPVLSVVFAPDGRTLATSSGDDTVRLWLVG
jgi:WD40 repeat protein